MSFAKKIVITGASGFIGSVLAPHLADHYEVIFSDIAEPRNPSLDKIVNCDVKNLDALRVLCQGADCIVHLAADSRLTATWESLLPNNIVGTYNVFKAASDAGCGRVVFAGSINSVGGHPRHLRPLTDMAGRPANLYGASKAWGEVLARFYADQARLSCICLRLGWVRENALNPNEPGADIVLTFDDLVSLVLASIDAPEDLRFGIFHGISKNRWKQYDISETTSGRDYTLQEGYHLSGRRRIRLVLKRIMDKLMR